MTNKNYISIVLFLFLFIIGYLYLDKVFRTPHFYNNSIQDFKVLAKKTNIDVIFYGSSHSYKTFNPLIINNKCKTISYNLGSDALALSLTDLVLEESLKHTNPKLVVLDLYSGVLNVRNVTPRFKGYQLRVLDVVSNSKKKLKKIKYFFNNDELINVYSRLFRNHKKWNSVDFFNLDRRIKKNKKISIYTNGYVGSFIKISKSSNDYYKKYNNFKKFKIKRNNSKTALNDKAKEKILSFIKLADKKNIQVLIVSAPDLRARTWNYNLYDELTDFCKSKNINFLNLNNFYDEIGLTIEDFQDPSHLNIFGGKKTSIFVANYINKNYKLENRLADNEWSHLKNEYLDLITLMNENYGVFNKKINKKLVDNIIITDIHIEKSPNNIFFKILFDNSKKSFEEISNYKISISIYPKEKQYNFVCKRSKSKGWLFDKKDVLLNEPKVEVNIQTKITDIKKIKLFLYDKEKFNGVIGKPIYIKDIIFH